MNSETYTEMKDRHQREVNELPIKFAFSTEQFNSMLASWNIQPGEESEKLYTLTGSGGYYLKADSQLIADTFNRIDRETKAAIEADTTGSGFIYDMFLYELNNHKYGYTGRTEDTLDALGFTRSDIEQSEPLYNGLVKAIKTIEGQPDIF